MKATVHRKAHFNAAHRLFLEEWSEEKNVRVFGKCSNPHFHGHNYDLIVSVTGEIDPETGFVISIDFLKSLIKTEIEDVFDHRNINEEIPEFKTLNPTTENISAVIWQKLRDKIDNQLDLEITLYETPRNFVTFPGK